MRVRVQRVCQKARRVISRVRGAVGLEGPDYGAVSATLTTNGMPSTATFTMM